MSCVYFLRGGFATVNVIVSNLRGVCRWFTSLGKHVWSRFPRVVKFLFGHRQYIIDVYIYMTLLSTAWPPVGCHHDVRHVPAWSALPLWLLAAIPHACRARLQCHLGRGTPRTPRQHPVDRVPITRAQTNAAAAPQQHL